MAETLLKLASFIGTFLPGVFYGFLIYLSLIKGSVNLRRIWPFFFAGIFCVNLLMPVFYVVPRISDPVQQTVMWIVFQMFFQVALLEESTKLMMFKFFNKKFELKGVAEHVFAYTILGCGFAAAENFSYLQSEGPLVLILRTFTSVILHMAAGAAAGKLVYEGKKKTAHEGKKKTALILAVFLHGFYNASLVVGSYFHVLKIGVMVSLGLAVLVAYSSFHSSLRDKYRAFTK